MPTVQLVHSDFTTQHHNYHKMMKALIDNGTRNRMIAEQVYRNRNRYNLVLSSRIEHIEKMVAIYRDMGGECEVATGALKTNERNANHLQNEQW